ncbi:hypothetical protein N1851_017218 [Merluccius polli]|uniref:Uncharacterized protein n=1 Tax=Merluccius polli TaxID=89951 RepID=A0AA47MPT0_MERPO|nr:hypothetical protein N1851_017218 [Merluccius polli]
MVDENAYDVHIATPGSQPTLEQLNKCRKVDLMLIASGYDVQVPPGIRKEELRLLLLEKLWEKGVLSVSASAESEGKEDAEIREPVPPVTPVRSDPPFMPGSSAEELRLTLRIREMEMRNRQLEVEAMHLRSKEQSKSKSPSAVGLIHSEPTISQQGNLTEVDDSFKPFTTQGFASLTGNEAVRIPITILRDTGAKHSVARRGMLPFSDQSYCGSDLLLWGIKLSVIRAPRHTVYLSSTLVSGTVQVAVRDQLPVAGVDLILGNDLAGNKVFPSAPEVTENPTADSCVTSTAPDAQWRLLIGGRPKWHDL